MHLRTAETDRKEEASCGGGAPSRHLEPHITAALPGDGVGEVEP